MVSCRSLLVLLLVLLGSHANAQQRVPGDSWQIYTDVSEAGFDPDLLEAARQAWEKLPSSAFLVIADGAIVASWGEVDRRFMCHSVRKSFLSALYGIYWDRGEIELNKTMAELGIDDAPSPLLEIEKQARILDLLKARSAVYHPAAYAGRTDSAPRGSISPGQAFGYNNWDFNTLASILMQLTGDDIFAAFDEHFAQPLGMQDWRISDGYYHYERDKSKYPAYPFRMSARDAARFGLLYARNGMWGEQRILSHHWVNRSTALYSIDSPLMGYGFMWWVLRKPSLEEHGMVAALGVGNQMIAALPKSDIVIVNRANTYLRENTPTPGLIALIDQVLEARTGKPSDQPKLVAATDAAAPRYQIDAAKPGLTGLAGSYQFPPESLGLEPYSSLTLSEGPGYLMGETAFAGSFRFYLQHDGSLLREDAGDRYFVVRKPDSLTVDGIAGIADLFDGAIRALARGDAARAEALLLGAQESEPIWAMVGLAMMRAQHEGGPALEPFLSALRDAEADGGTALLERVILRAGHNLSVAEQVAQAADLYASNVRLFPESANAWEALGEAQAKLGQAEAAEASYQRCLKLNPENPGVRDAIRALRRE
jgi:CubicO group peptidase (beta-lactamase class C family)